MMKPKHFFLWCVAMCYALNIQAGDVVITTNKAVGEKFTLATDAGITLTLKWGNGTEDSYTSDGFPATFDIKDAKLTMSSEAEITRLYMPEDGITELNVNGIKKTLKKLYVPSNELTKLDLYSCQLITELDVQDNELESIDFFYNLVNLEALNCAGNKLKKLDYFQSPRVQRLVIAGNKLTAVPVETLLPQLRSVFAQNNELDHVNLRYSTRVKNLVLSNNPLTALDLSPMTPLKELWVGNNKLTTLDVSQNHELVTLVAPNNGLAAITWDAASADYGKLANFDVSGNALHFNSFPTVTLEEQPINAILTPQKPFFFLDQVEVEKSVDIKSFQKNGWGVSVKPTITYYNSKGEEMVKGTDYTQVRNLVFKTPAWSPHVEMEVPDFYPGMRFISQNFRITGPDAISSVQSDAATSDAYTLGGVRMNGKNLPKGIYIINGKKVVR